MSKHTPGPWTLSQQQRWPFCLTTTAVDGYVIAVADLSSSSTGDKTTAEANARDGNGEVIANETLRSAAPDLLDALKAARSDLWLQIEAKHGPEAASRYPSVVKADAAISKAEG